MNSSRKIIFVVPWYGKYATGGAEIQCKSLAEHLKKAGLDIEIYTTCSKQFASDWGNDFKSGEDFENGVSVKRFKVDRRDKQLFNSINAKILSSQKISLQEEEEFFQNSINSKDLMKAIAKDSTSLFVFIPYLYGTTYYGCQIHPERSVMIPCLHNEGYANMSLMKKAISQVRAISFNSVPERDFAYSLLNSVPENQVLAEGIDIPIKENLSNKFKEKYNLKEFILCAGRKEKGKNTDLLIEYFSRFLENNNTDLKLILTGKGDVKIPPQFSKNIISTFLTQQELYQAYSAATVLCLPSINESFSRVIMEAWLCSTPVLVHEQCKVTKYHCISSNGGLFFQNYEEFEECIKFLLKNEDIRNKLGENGQRYVKNNFNWDKITAAYKEFFKSLNS